MSKMSIRFLVGFVAVTVAGAASAQGADGFSGTVTNGMASTLSSLGASSDAKLGAGPREVSGFSAASGATGSANMFSALRAADALPVATGAKLGGGAGKPVATGGENPFANATASASMSMSNALASAPNGQGDDKAVAFIGAGTSNFANALSGQTESVSARLPTK